MHVHIELWLQVFQMFWSWTPLIHQHIGQLNLTIDLFFFCTFLAVNYQFLYSRQAETKSGKKRKHHDLNAL